MDYADNCQSLKCMDYANNYHTSPKSAWTVDHNSTCRPMPVPKVHGLLTQHLILKKQLGNPGCSLGESVWPVFYFIFYFNFIFVKNRQI